MFETLKKIRQGRLVKRLSSVKRARVMRNFDNIKLIGIVFNITTEANWIKLSNYVKELESYGKKVYLVGIIDTKDKLNFIITNTKVTIVHRKKDVSCFGIPKRSRMKKFLSKKFDVLINTINDDDFFSSIVALRSLAKLRVATDTPAHKEVYDLLIKVDSKTSETEFLKQVINCLTLINK